MVSLSLLAKAKYFCSGDDEGGKSRKKSGSPGKKGSLTARTCAQVDSHSLGIVHRAALESSLLRHDPCQLGITWQSVP
jgi:hypothetical protein